MSLTSKPEPLVWLSQNGKAKGRGEISHIIRRGPQVTVDSDDIEVVDKLVYIGTSLINAKSLLSKVTTLNKADDSKVKSCSNA